MSQENIDLARRGYEAFNRGDIDRLLDEIFAPEFEYVPTGAIPGIQGTYQGPRWREFAGWMASEFERPRIEAHELIELGNQVLASVTLRGRGKQSGAEVSWDVWHLWTTEDGRVIRGQAFRTREEAREAAGLSE